MPKMKTHKGTKKRVKVTGSGKISLNLFLKKQFNKIYDFYLQSKVKKSSLKQELTAFYLKNQN